LARFESRNRPAPQTGAFGAIFSNLVTRASAFSGRLGFAFIAIAKDHQLLFIRDS
jgi:1-aminocyclopropane-1-carboxylate deaminase/D-cysteine desulfhydrase-like pyridoxal-dependent ACC family enzyme